jgi:phage terminase large subunit GpA-like protein
MEKIEVASRLMYLRGRRMSFAGRPYLNDIYASQARRVVIRASRQVEKTTFLVVTIIYLALMHPGIHIVVVFPRQEQARVFSSRLMTMIEGSPVPRRVLLAGKSNVRVLTKHFADGTEVYLRAAYHTADAARGIDGDVLMVDELQDVAPGSLPVLEECLSHSRHRKVFLTGTPKLIENHLEGVFDQSTACR